MIDSDLDDPVPAPDRPRYWPWFPIVFGLVTVAGLLIFAFIPAVATSREAARRSQCVCNFCMLKLAMHNYHSTYGSLPPAYVTDAQGTPIHSWRVLILPFMEQQALYEQYNFSEPWNGPNNRKLLDQRPNVLLCPSATAAAKQNTNYVAITGPGTAFPGASTVKFDEITDGTANTLFLAETTSLDVPWTAPIDLDVRTMSFRLNDPSRPSISSKHPGGANVVLVDGSYRFLKDKVNPDDLRALMTIAGGEIVEIEGWESVPAPKHEPKP